MKHTNDCWNVHISKLAPKSTTDIGECSVLKWNKAVQAKDWRN